MIKDMNEFLEYEKRSKKSQNFVKCDISAAIIVNKLVLSLGQLDFITCIEWGLIKKKSIFTIFKLILHRWNFNKNWKKTL